ncbi:MAG: ABC transporter permease, partial [Elioraea tepidiphila]
MTTRALEAARNGAAAAPAAGLARLKRRAGRWALRGLAGLVFFFIFIPVIFVLWISLFEQQIVSFPPEGYTLRWYENAFARSEFRHGFGLSLQVAFIAMVIGVTSGAAGAYAIVRFRFPGREAFNNLLLGPLVVPGIVAGTSLYVYYIMVENLLDVDFRGTLHGLVLGHILLTIPWTVRLVSASLVGLDRAVEEAALHLGAGTWTT